MFGQIHNNLRDAVQQSFNRPPMPKAKGLPKGVKLPYPFGAFGNMPGSKARQVNALAKEASQKAKATANKFGFNDSQMIPGMSKPKPKAKTQRPGTSTTTGVDLMKGKWVKKGLGRRWQPDGLNRPMTPFEEHQWAVQKNMDSHKGKPKKEPEYVKNTWQPEGDMIGFY